jgi:hypothetical protein
MSRYPERQAERRCSNLISSMPKGANDLSSVMKQSEPEELSEVRVGGARHETNRGIWSESVRGELHKQFSVRFKCFGRHSEALRELFNFSREWSLPGPKDLWMEPSIIGGYKSSMEVVDCRRLVDETALNMERELFHVASGAIEERNELKG